MELSLLNLRDDKSGRSPGERRLRIRHRLHSPAYASFNEPNAGMVLELNELHDLSEEGFAFHAASPLPVNQAVTFSLDLTDTKAKVYGAGRVAWNDATGRAGIRFSGLSDESQRALKEWLLINLFVAATTNSKTKPTVVVPTKSNELLKAPQPVAGVAPIDSANLKSEMDKLRSEVQTSSDFDTTLHLIAERALSLTGATGSALAFSTGDNMVCRASAGQPAMPLKTAVDAKHGLTGECVRGGRMVACQDAESDSRVDQEICGALGIRSILAAPIVADFRVVGLLEVFSPNPNAFAQIHETALDRLVELVPKQEPIALPSPDSVALAKQNAAEPPAAALTVVREAVWEQEREAQEPLRGVPVRLAHIVLLVLTLAALFLVAGYLSAPKIEKLWLSRSLVANGPATRAVAAVPTASRVTPGMPFDQLRRLAEVGDAYAQWMLGTRYHNGEGVPQDDGQAMRWFERAADQGYVDAQASAGAYYLAGRGVPRDLTRAYFWSTLALSQGDSSMESRLQFLVIQMTKAQIATAQRQADEWLDHHPAKSAAK